VEQEVQVLALHGLLHLLGEDHERDHGRMARLERTWRLQLGLPRSLTERSRRALRASAGCGRRKSLPDRRP
jgi:probable rRNA maturation factor